jgi:hypothetical protein
MTRTHRTKVDRDDMWNVAHLGPAWEPGTPVLVVVATDLPDGCEVTMYDEMSVTPDDRVVYGVIVGPKPAPTERVPWHEAIRQQLSVPTPSGPVEVNGCRCVDGLVTLTRRNQSAHHLTSDVVLVQDDGMVEVLAE